MSITIEFDIEQALLDFEDINERASYILGEKPDLVRLNILAIKVLASRYKEAWEKLLHEDNIDEPVIFVHREQES